MKGIKKQRRRIKRVLTNMALMVFIALIIVGGITLTGNNTKAAAVSSVDVVTPIIYKSYTDQQLTDEIFTKLISVETDITSGEAIFQVKNIWDTNIPINTRYDTQRNKVKKITYYYLGNVTRKRQETTYKKTLDKTTPNGTKIYTTTPVTKTITYTQEEWIKTNNIPALFKGRMKAVGEWEKPAYAVDRVQIDWIPQINVKESSTKTLKTLEQVKWAWWDASWSKKYPIYMNSSANGTHFLEPSLINLTEYNVACPTEDNFSSIRIIANDTINIPWQYHSTNTSGEGWTIWFNANTTEETNALVKYDLYCNNPASAEGNQSVYAFYEISDGITDNADYTRKFNENIVANASMTRINGATVGLNGHGHLINFTPTSNTGRQSKWLENLTNKNFTVVFHTRKATNAKQSYIEVGRDNKLCGGLTWQDTIIPGLMSFHDGVTGASTVITKENNADFFTVRLEYTENTGTFAMAVSNDSITYNARRNGLTPKNANTNYGKILLYGNTNPTETYIDDIFVSEQNISVYKTQNNYTIGAILTPPSAIQIANNTEQPASPTTWDYEKFVFNTTVRHNDNRTNITNIVFELDGTNYSVTNITDGWQGLNATYTYNGHLDVGNHPYAWYANDTNGDNDTLTGTYTVTRSTNNNVSYTITPSTSINAGDSVTINCSASIGTPYLRFDSIKYTSLPKTFTPFAGTHSAFCYIETENYTDKNNGTYITVATLSGGSAGCSDNYTYAFQGSLLVTNNTMTVVNMSEINEVNYREDLQDIWIPGHQYWINQSGDDDLLIINTTGEAGTVLTVNFGNTFNNNNIPYWNGDLTVNESLTNFTTIANYTILSYTDEKTQTQTLPENMSDFYVDFSCTDGEKRYTYDPNTNRKQYLFATNYTFEQSITTVEYTDNSFYTRSILYTQPIENRYVWLMNAQNDSVSKVTNLLRDYTGLFSPGAKLTITKVIGSAIRTIDERYFDASNLHSWYGLLGKTYTYTITGPDGDVRNIGDIVVDQAELEKEIVLQQETLEDSDFKNIMNGISWDLTGTSPHSAGLCYNSTTNITNEFYITSIKSDLEFYGLNLSHNGTLITSIIRTNSTGGTITTSIDLSGYSIGDTINAEAFFKRQGYDLYIIERDYTIKNCTYGPASIKNLFETTLLPANTGLSKFGTGMISLVISAVIAASVGVIAGGLGGGAVLVASLGFFALMGWGVFTL